MKRTLNLFVLFIVFNGSAQNLVPNGDFEMGPDSSSQGWQSYVIAPCILSGTSLGPDSWILNSGSPDRMINGNVFTCNWDFDVAYSGLAWIDFIHQESASSTLILPIEQDSSYTLSCYLKQETFQGLFTDSSRLAFILNNGTDSIVSPLITSAANWVFFETSFVASGSATEITITGIGPGFSGTKIDDLALIKTSGHPLGLNELTPTYRKLVKIVDLFGRDTTYSPNTVQIYVYSDGTNEKRYIVE